MDDRISTSFLSRAASAIADTNNGLGGAKIVDYCNAFAVDHNVEIPHAASVVQAPNKRTALLENLQAFPATAQYELLMELTSDAKLHDNPAVQEIRQLLLSRYAHLASTHSAQQTPVSDQSPSVAAQAVHPASPVASSEPAVPFRPHEVFLSYSHADEELMTFVRKHLVICERIGRIRKTWDRMLLPGQPLDEALMQHLSSSDIILLFVSSDFLASKYCYEVEMKQALRQHQEGRSVVIPIILRHCLWQVADFGHLLALPRDGRPLTAWSDKDEAAKNIVEEVMRVAAELQAKQIQISPKS
jgi:hypothetical protein